MGRLAAQREKQAKEAAKIAEYYNKASRPFVAKRTKKEATPTKSASKTVPPVELPVVNKGTTKKWDDDRYSEDFQPRSIPESNKLSDDEELKQPLMHARMNFFKPPVTDIELDSVSIKLADKPHLANRLYDISAKFN